MAETRQCKTSGHCAQATRRSEVDEGLAYADRLHWAGVRMDLELARGVVHDFMKMGRALPEARRALDWCAQALRRAWLTNTPQRFSL